MFYLFYRATKAKPREKFYDVTLGLYDRCNVTLNAETFKVTKVTIHEKYVTSVDLYDISLLTLNKVAAFMPVCLPAKGRYEKISSHVKLIAEPTKPLRLFL